MKPGIPGFAAVLLASWSCALPRPPLRSSASTSQDPLQRVVDSVQRSTQLQDLRAIVGERHAATTPEALAHAAAYITDVFSTSQWSVQRQPVTYQQRHADNLIAERAGRDPSRVIILAAHYDSVRGTPGADDDASGIVVLLSVARALAHVSLQITVRLIAFCFEEDWLVGSTHYVQSLPREERSRIAAVIDMDMVAYSQSTPRSQRYPSEIHFIAQDRVLRDRADFVGVMGLTEHLPLLRVMRWAQTYEPGLRVEYLAVPGAVRGLAPDLSRGDHAPFWDAGIPAVMVGDTAEFRSTHYHGATDTIETLDLRMLHRVGRWMTATTLLLAGPMQMASP